MAKNWENLTETEKKEILEQIRKQRMEDYLNWLKDKQNVGKHI